jgi:hypothetical protein
VEGSIRGEGVSGEEVGGMAREDRLGGEDKTI